jgi:hypothetical protein
MTLQAAIPSPAPIGPTLPDLGEAMVHAMPTVEAPPESSPAGDDATPIVEAPENLDGVQERNDALRGGDPANFAAFALEAARKRDEADPARLAAATFADLPPEAVQALALRMWASEIRRAVGRLRTGRNAPQSPAWAAVADAHKIGRLDVARWSINGEWIVARELTLEQVGKLHKYYRQQEVAYGERKRRFTALYDAMRDARAKTAGDLGDEPLAAILFG